VGAGPQSQRIRPLAVGQVRTLEDLRARGDGALEVQGRDPLPDRGELVLDPGVLRRRGETHGEQDGGEDVLHGTLATRPLAASSTRSVPSGQKATPTGRSTPIAVVERNVARLPGGIEQRHGLLLHVEHRDLSRDIDGDPGRAAEHGSTDRRHREAGSHAHETPRPLVGEHDPAGVEGHRGDPPVLRLAQDRPRRSTRRPSRDTLAFAIDDPDRARRVDGERRRRGEIAEPRDRDGSSGIETDDLLRGGRMHPSEGIDGERGHVGERRRRCSAPPRVESLERLRLAVRRRRTLRPGGPR
jgi:hypothetical protein